MYGPNPWLSCRMSTYLSNGPFKIKLAPMFSSLSMGQHFQGFPRSPALPNPKIIPKASQNHPKSIPKSSQKHPKIIPKSSQKHPKIIPKAPQNHRPSPSQKGEDPRAPWSQAGVGSPFIQGSRGVPLRVDSKN